MISSRHRFHGYRSLNGVYRYGNNVRGPLFGVKSLKNPKRKGYRLAVVVSRKVHKSAVVRNRIRRRLYEVVRTMEADIPEPHDMVLTVFDAVVADQPPKELADQVKKQLTQAGIVKRRML